MRAFRTSFTQTEDVDADELLLSAIKFNYSCFLQLPLLCGDVFVFRHLRGEDEINFLHSQCQWDSLNKKCRSKTCMTISSGMNDESRSFKSCFLATLTDGKHFFKNVIGKLH